MEFCIGAGVSPRGTTMMWLSDGRKSFQIGLAVLIQYRSVTDTHPASQTRCRSKDTAYYVARVKTQLKIAELNRDQDQHQYRDITPTKIS